MKVFDFDIEKGIYSFELENLNTEKHSHPVVEIIVAKQGTFTVEMNGEIKNNLDFAVIGSNTIHKVSSQDCTVQILMIESHNELLYDFLKTHNIYINHSFFPRESFDGRKILSQIKSFAIKHDLNKSADLRINDCLKLILENEVEYKDLIESLTSEVFLSKSRLSHLFKKHIGISIKKYLVWNRLKYAIDRYLKVGSDLTDISLESGFFDQAHLSNAFKNVLGVSPSTAYNSRILQS